MWLVSFQEQRRLISLRRGVFSRLVSNLTAWYTCFFSAYFSLSLCGSLLISSSFKTITCSSAQTLPGWGGRKRKKRGGEDREAVRHPLGSLGPTRTNKQHCLFWSRAGSCWEPFHVFHQLSHLLSDTPSASVSHSLSPRSVCKNERGDETVSAWKKTAGTTSSQPPSVPLPAWWREDLTGADRRQLH